ncbi:TetR/AcrR family transcriptional regulator [Maritalea mediterranea]|uniref:TetR/AcrR family transcriptional regulator n=1 Tax=Maritalea mediterranea TaxID=2909667 RepID=A0ABS9E9X3_9HYPH|nr:TetR/AcrR family transcriptional regulator [Maritalea mediterranea]MCF4099686.1 TetR/AcrR family transcriptional regulator [Maritalea mediterranea]
MVKTERTKREKAKHAKRRLIVESAMTCFIKRGIAQTGIRDIADHAKISLGNLYNHFASKDALVAEIAQIEAEELKHLLEDLAAGLPLHAFMLRYLAQTASPEHAIFSVEILAAALRQPELAAPFDANRKALIKALVIQTNARSSDMELLLDAIEALGLRCGLDHRKPKRTEIESLQKLAAALT